MRLKKLTTLSAWLTFNEVVAGREGCSTVEQVEDLADVTGNSGGSQLCPCLCLGRKTAGLAFSAGYRAHLKPNDSVAAASVV